MGVSEPDRWQRFAVACEDYLPLLLGLAGSCVCSFQLQSSAVVVVPVLGRCKKDENAPEALLLITKHAPALCSQDFLHVVQ